MKIKWILPINLVSIMSSPLVWSTCLTSCNISNSYRCDGSNWIGVRAGKFYDTDYTINYQEKTITYNISVGLHTKNLVIPNYVNCKGQKFKVIIGAYCFYRNNRIVGSVELNDWMSSIPDYCFYQAYSLTEIIFHKKPVAFGKCCLYETSLRNIYERNKNGELVPSSFINVRYIGSGAFSSCLIGGELIFGSVIEKIGDYAFEDCINITRINLSLATSVTTIQKRAFRHCQMLQTISLPISITKIDDYAFEQCDSLRIIDFPSKKMNISFGDFAFGNCINLIGFNTSVKIKSIGRYCFTNDNNLDYFLFQPNDDISTISEGAFSGCQQVNVVKFNDKITEVKNFAFSNCSNLSVLDFTDCSAQYLTSVTWSGMRIFNRCSSTGVIYIDSGQVFSDEWIQFLKDNGINFSQDPFREDGWIIKNIELSQRQNIT